MARDYLARKRDAAIELYGQLAGDDVDLDAIGRLLHEDWALKRALDDTVSSNEIDAVYDTARSAGALGGKLLGAGGGGFLLFYVPEQAQAAVAWHAAERHGQRRRLQSWAGRSAAR